MSTSVTDAVASGDQVATLVALRDRLAQLIDDPDTKASDISPLTRRFQEVVEQLAAARALADDAANRDAAVKEAAANDQGFDPAAL
ncbi:hypothetical protein [Gordonia sp. DT101]|uniref:hypothetical protein n=1 Tax=Gordonia sp. DT101 TaxID=3416545 RepID=UPI003CF22F60